MTRAPAPLRWLRVRLIIVAAVLTGGFGAIAFKAWTLQIRDGAKMKALAEAQHRHDMVIAAPRGTIRDRNGVELAITVDGDSVEANPREVVDVAGSAAAAAKALGLDVIEVEEKLASGKRFAWLKRRVTPDEARRIRELALPGIRVVSEPRRFYPGRELAGPVLGFADLDAQGIEGIEHHLDEVLKGERSRMPAVRDGRGQLVLAHGWADPAAPAPGELASAGATVTLTIDRTLQFVTERALAEAVATHKARAGTVVVMDPRTGEILALASLPTYDPNDPGKHEGARNRAVVDAYEPGSVMKVFTIAAALEAGAIRAGDGFDVEGGRLQVGSKTITDTHKGEHWLTIGEIMKYSSNVGAVKIARRLGREGLTDALRAFGFGARTGVELPGEQKGRIRAADTLREIELATMSYGYGMTATPIQIAAAMSTIAAGGEWRAPALVKRIVEPGGVVAYEHRVEGRRVVSEQTAADVTRMLEQVMEKGGTGEKIVVPGFVLAGKTGTAYKLDPATKRYAVDKYMSSFVGFAPSRDARLVILVMIDEPGGPKHYGGEVAGPVFQKVAEEGLKYLGVAPTEPIAPAAAKNPPPAVAGVGGSISRRSDNAARPEAAVPPTIDEALDLPPAGPGEPIVVIPDFTGMSIGEALAAARAAGVQVDISGSGRAVKQFPPPGRALKSITCRIAFDPGQ